MARILTAAIVLFCVACNDDFMNRTPVSDLNNESYWTSENDLKVYNNGIYNAVIGVRFFIGNEHSASGSKEYSFMAMEAASDNFASTDVNLQKWANIAAGLHTVPAGATTTTGLSWLMRWKKGAYLAKPVLGIRLEAADIAAGGRYDATGKTAPATLTVSGKNYIDAYAGTQFARDKRVFDEIKHYLYPVPTNIRAKNPELDQSPGWGD
jgi:hypothetical protein